MKRKLALQRKGVVTATLEVELDFEYEDKKVLEDQKLTNLFFYGFIAQIKIENLDLRGKQAFMIVRLRGADLDMRKRSEINLQNENAVIKITDKVRFFLADEELEQLSKVYFDIALKEPDGKESVIGVTNMEISTIRPGDNKIE